MKNLFKNLRSDFPSSIVVFLVAIPLCLGIALGSNAPMFSGLIAGIVGGIVIGSLSGSHLSVSGPAAGLTVIVAAAIGELPTFQAFLLAVVLAGLFQLIFGFIRAGVLGDYVPSSVISGMLASIGLILILKQIPHLVGYGVNYSGDETFSQSNDQNTFSGIYQAANFITPLAVIIGVVALFIQLIWERYLVAKSKTFRLLPAPLVVVLMAVLINEVFIRMQHPWALQKGHLVNIPISDSVAGFVSFFSFPDLGSISLPAVWTSAITLAIVASLETLLNIGAADELDPYKRVTPTNRELKAQGIGNIVSGLIGGLPITSVIVRTSANINAGAKSKASTILHGLFLLVCVSLIPGILNLIPLSALAAILIYTGFKLAKPAVFRKYYRKGFDQFIPFIVTIIAILLTDLLVGILIGIITALFFLLWSNFKTSIYVVADGNKYLIRLRKDVSFLNKPILKKKLEEVPAGSSVLIDCSKADFIDKDILEVINYFLKHAHLRNIQVEIKQSIAKPDNELIGNSVMLRNSEVGMV